MNTNCPSMMFDWGDGCPQQCRLAVSVILLYCLHSRYSRDALGFLCGAALPATGRGEAG